MAEKFQNKYRIPPARAQWWNYINQAAYFITICTYQRQCYFGYIQDGEMHLNEIGKVAAHEWLKTAEIRKDMNIELGEFVVMPNHMHGIVIIGDNEYNIRDTETDGMKNNFGPQSKNLASIIRGYKSSVTSYAKNNTIDFAWQPLYHDHIIRNQESFQNITNYIVQNPEKWYEDKFFV